ncbi:Transcriptional regulator GlxA family, contains an amidase domain and an AraC-type DNA-binding HTH domain [Pseudomonas sp. NFPP07]|uniref:GlxA family transcriptional regulator n=1 Tax=Pseudomonas TaxID=286 RepID=UPI00026E4307|nr:MULTISPECIES: helix-turn-helix domain-containing protein [Pseudomonas]EJL08641.1 transcriptional regulator, AraC family [Pseudomonas chlororaphis subsp. aureofaciens 30-84]MCP1479505.1 transcriptional regulator GlxA family with amidase domain [Pseudomonas chlororaphis]MCP1594143.1 transcriptional regulator GlxA family with amidase domain [Pseudomonas chlororaphis]ROL84033.1 transcriptional regulator [Pseudomonas chlororaphis]SEK60202.1 Transcriptional regulator GlxA family, contains an amid
MHVTLLLADHCSAASATLALEVLSAANLFADSASAPFEVVVASLDGADVSAWGGQALRVQRSVAEIARTDLVLIPGFLFTLKEALPAFARHGPWLRQQHAQGAVLASMCTATFLLAEAGLLKGARATTHWAFAELFRRRYAGVELDEGQLLCEDDRLITSGGASAAMDLLLHLVRRFASLELAQKCGKYLLIDKVRSEQSVYVMWSLPKSHGDGEILRVQDWLEEHFDQPLLIDDTARRFGFGVRNFKRRFKEATGYTPLAYLQTLRLEKAKELLESTRMTLDSITYKVGYEDSNSFRRLFQQRVGLLPAAYRKKFQAGAS